jgi:hypothetical protein
VGANLSGKHAPGPVHIIYGDDMDGLSHLRGLLRDLDDQPPLKRAAMAQEAFDLAQRLLPRLRAIAIYEATRACGQRYVADQLGVKLGALQRPVATAKKLLNSD